MAKKKVARRSASDSRAKQPISQKAIASRVRSRVDRDAIAPPASGTPTRAELIDALTRMQKTLAARRELLCSIPRRGYSPDPNAPKMPLHYTIPSCGAGVVLRLITEGQLDVITRTLVDALIAELRS